jgi:hypothetical protein
MAPTMLLASSKGLCEQRRTANVRNTLGAVVNESTSLTRTSKAIAISIALHHGEAAMVDTRKIQKEKSGHNQFPVFLEFEIETLQLATDISKSNSRVHKSSKLKAGRR